MLHNKASFVSHVEFAKDKRVHAFPKSIFPKVNAIVHLEVEFTHFAAAGKHLGYYGSGTTFITLSYNYKL